VLHDHDTTREFDINDQHNPGFVEHDKHHESGQHINLDDNDDVDLHLDDDEFWTDDERTAIKHSHNLDRLDDVITAYVNDVYRDIADSEYLDYVRAINDATNRILRYDTDINRLAAALNNVDNYSDTDFDPIGALVDAARTIVTRHTVTE